MKKKKSPIIKNIVYAIQSGMEQGFTIDQSLQRLGIERHVYNKYCDCKQVKIALVNGESLFRAFWDDVIQKVSLGKNHNIRGVNVQVLLAKYKENMTIKEKEKKQRVPKIAFSNVIENNIKIFDEE